MAEGIPLLPLQTLWVSFTMLSIQSVGLGYSKPAAGLTERPPLPLRLTGSLSPGPWAWSRLRCSPCSSRSSKDERDSAFSLDTFSEKTFRIATGGSFALLVLPTVLDIFHIVLKTVTLDVVQWLICTAVALAILAAEIRKAVLRRTAAAPGMPVSR
jgi:P-type Ca2+ transporter type 2C